MDTQMEEAKLTDVEIVCTKTRLFLHARSNFGKLQLESIFAVTDSDELVDIGFDIQYKDEIVNKLKENPRLVINERGV